MKVNLSQLQLKEIHIKEFILEENLEGQNKFSIDMDFEPILIKKNEKDFDGLLVKVKINDRLKNVKLKVKTELVAIFEFNGDLSKEKRAMMLLYNGLSIVYGFLRGLIFQKCSYISPQDRIIPNINIAELIEKTVDRELSKED